MPVFVLASGGNGRVDFCCMAEEASREHESRRVHMSIIVACTNTLYVTRRGVIGLRAVCYVTLNDALFFVVPGCTTTRRCAPLQWRSFLNV